MKLNIVLHTSDFRGDHEADVYEHLDPKPGETLEQLAERVWGGNRHKRYDFLRIQPVVEHIDAFTVKPV